MMVRRSTGAEAEPKAVGGRKVLLRVRGLTVSPRVNGVNLQLRAGEIVGLAGLAGAGQVEVGRAIAGLQPYRAAQITLEDRPFRARTPWDALRRGVIYLPADRGREGLFLRLSVKHNIVASSLNKLRWGPWLNDIKARETAQQFVESLSIRTPSLDQSALKLILHRQQRTGGSRQRD